VETSAMTKICGIFLLMEATFIHGDFNISNLIGPGYDPASSPHATVNVQVTKAVYCKDGGELDLFISGKKEM
jgi:hypothetical protein